MKRLCLYAAGKIAVIIICVVLMITGLSVILAIIFAKLNNDRQRRVILSLKSELR
jgi:hypothetical protein